MSEKDWEPLVKKLPDYERKIKTNPYDKQHTCWAERATKVSENGIETYCRVCGKEL